MKTVVAEAREFAQALRQNGFMAKVIIAEAETLINARQSDGPVQACAFGVFKVLGSVESRP